MNNIITDRNKLIELRKKLKSDGKKIVFTNGCFDIIHAGHIDYLTKAKALGDVLIVALNSDESVKRIKGKNRPIAELSERLFVVSQIKAVDYVTVFEEDTPGEIIAQLVPDILVKGADWDIDKIVGRDIVEKHGGIVKNIEFKYNQSTSTIISKIIDLQKD
ncbi:MAG: D-glycero-beta-D-manno-heptose 1-phosphate adenylyltransferase [Melioribacteraceae bacterium]|nr:D-glycero-beta-D-manno-heptose 1-phosphate adenylyltransferase [Melioribacteraceae bacterium]